MGAHAKSLNTRGHTPDFIRPDLSTLLCDRKETLQSVSSMPILDGLWRVKYETCKKAVRDQWNMKYSVSESRETYWVSATWCRWVFTHQHPPSLQRKSFFFHLREKWDLLISHGAASPHYDVPQGWRALTLPCRLNSQKVKWQSESRYSRCVIISPN